MRILLAAAAVLLVVPASAAAVPVEVSGGKARFSFDGGASTRLPIRSGKLNGLNGRLELGGRLRGFSKLTVLLGPRGFVRGTKAGEEQRILTVDTSAAKAPDDTSVTGLRLRPTGPFEGRSGLKGTLAIDAAPKFLRLAGGRSELLLDQSFRDVLEAEQITPAGGEGAPITDDGAIAFPIAKGRLKTRGLEGQINHSGGITFSKGNQPSLRFEDFVIDTRANTAAGRVNDAATREALFTAALPKGTIVDEAATFAATPALLTQAAADVLNGTFSTSVFSAGQLLGTVSVSAQYR